MSTSQLSPGTVVDGRFTVGAVLRTRVGATTYEATDHEGQSVALTIYDEACFPSSLVLERSLRELRQLQGTGSPRVLSVLAAGRHGDGLFEATPVPPERSLGQFLQAGPLALRDAAGILVQVGEALLEGQRLGVTHRNLGADVVFPSPQGVKVTGFAVGEPHGEASHGSLPTMAPEQVEGKVVDQRTLIYNLAALMHWMLRGQPLFSGSPQDVLHHHVSTEPGDDVHTALRRALDKDARLRPMMLKPFLVDIAEVAGVDPPRDVEAEPQAGESLAPSADAVTPSSRGWTMFMAAAEDDVSKAEAEAKKPAAAAPPAAAEIKPSTRGWTMFMNADEDEDDDDEPASVSVAKPASEAKTAAAPEPEPEDEAKPSTRGWTMFMTTEEAEEPEASPAKQDSPAPAEEAKPSGPTATSEVKPSTRGWTMFMNADEDEDDDDEAPVAATPADAPSPAASSAPVSPEPASAASPATPAPAPTAPPADEAKPSTRGWTMFMTAEEGEDGDEPAQDPAPVAEPKPASAAPAALPTSASAPAPAAAPAPVTPTVPSAPSEDAPVAHANAPSGSAAAGSKSRGWTIFMEPATDGATKDGPVAPTVRPEAAPAKPKAPEPAAAASERAAPLLSQRPVPGSAAANPGQKKRGWTMFMNAPIPELKKPGASGASVGSPGAAPLGSQPLVPTPKPGPAATTGGSPPGGSPSTPGSGTSDTRGWTVFGAPAPMRTPAAPPLTPPPGVKPLHRPASEPSRGETAISTRPPSEPQASANREASAPQPQASPEPIPAGLSNMPTARTVPGGGEALAALTDRQGNDLAKPAAKRTGWVLVGAVIGVGVVASIVAWLLG